MPRVMCIWFPDWPLQRLRIARPNLARSEIAIFTKKNQRPVIRVCSRTAHKFGLRIGQSLAEARSLLPRAVFLPDDQCADREALVQLAYDCQRFSPLVGLEDAPESESLLSDVTGCTHLWNGEKTFLQVVARYFRERRFHIQLALAGSVGAAWALAHHSKFSVIPAGAEQPSLANLPIDLLRLPPDSLESLHTLGLHTIGSAMALPRETLASRFGAILPRRLSQSHAEIPETFVSERLHEPLSSIRESEVPIEDRSSVAFLCRQMLRELLVAAEALGVGLHECHGEVRTETSSIQIELRLVEPTRDLEHLTQLVDLQLERMTWSGGVISIRWVASRLSSLEQAQASWFSNEQESKKSKAFHHLVERLTSRLEPHAVLRGEVLPDPEPEHAAQLLPWTSSHFSKNNAYLLPPEQSRSRPFRLLEQVEPIDVTALDSGGPPLSMIWNRQTYLVNRAWGPERIATGWWRIEDTERDYYRAEWHDGSHVWVYFDIRQARWFLHGFFD